MIKKLEQYTQNKIWSRFEEVPAGRLAMLLDELLYSGYVSDIKIKSQNDFEAKRWIFPLELSIKDRTGDGKEYATKKVDDLFRELRDELEAWAIAQLLAQLLDKSR